MTLELPFLTWERLTNEARDRGLSVSALLRMWLMNHLRGECEDRIAHRQVELRFPDAQPGSPSETGQQSLLKERNRGED